MDMDEKLKHPNASVLLKPKPELAYFLDFDSNTQNRICGQQRLHGRKETNNLHKILSKYQASAQQQRRMNNKKIPSRIMTLVCSVSENICWDTDPSAS